MKTAIFALFATILPAVPAPTAEPDLITRLLPIVKMAESSGNPWAVGGGSYGLYQITKVTLAHYNQVNGAQYGVEDLFDPEINERIADWYLRYLDAWLTRNGYPGDVPRIVYAYNTGMGKLRDNGFQLPPWTLDHTNRIYREIYRRGGIL